MPWFTDAQITALPAFAGLAPDQIPQLASDAGTLYRHIGNVAGISDSDLRSWAESAGIPPERYNVAVKALSQSGKAVQVDAGPFVPDQPPAATLPGVAGAVGDSIPTQHLTKDELGAIAERLKLGLPKSATKAEMAEAISRFG